MGRTRGTERMIFRAEFRIMLSTNNFFLRQSRAGTGAIYEIQVVIRQMSVLRAVRAFLDHPPRHRIFSTLLFGAIVYKPAYTYSQVRGDR
jgi:hypothetical protein